MSSYPKKDLHSVYIDKEMPDTFVKEYETNVKLSEKSSAELKRMTAIHDILQNDAHNKTVDSAFVAQSFERLQTKMRYSKVVGTANKPIPFPVKMISTAAATAAVFALVFMPLISKSQTVITAPEIRAISRTGNMLSSLAKNDVIIDGNLDSNISFAEGSTREQKTIQATTLASNRSRNTRSLGKKLASIDVFRPEFDSPAPIKISVPRFHELPTNEEDTVILPNFIDN